MLKRLQFEVPAEPCMEPLPQIAEQGAEIPLFLLPSEDKKRVGERKARAELFPCSCVASAAGYFGI